MVNRTSAELLACSCFARDQNRRFASREERQIANRVQEKRIASYELIQSGFVEQTVLYRMAPRSAAQKPVNAFAKFSGTYRSNDEVVGSDDDRAQKVLGQPVADDGKAWMRRPLPFEIFEEGNSWCRLVQ